MRLNRDRGRTNDGAGDLGDDGAGDAAAADLPAVLTDEPRTDELQEDLDAAE